MTLARTVALLGLGLTPSIVSAQIAPPDFGPMMAGAAWSGVREADRTSRRDIGRAITGAAIANPPSARLTSIAGVSTSAYRPSSAVTAQVKRQYVQFISETVSPQAGAQVKAVLDRQDPVRAWANLVGSDGLRPGDAADALAAYWILNWIIANGGDGGKAQAQGVRDQVRNVMASNPAFARLNEAQRQEMAEALMLNFLMQHTAYNDAYKRRDQAAMRRLGDAAVTRFRNEMGVDLRQLQLTNQGFVRRG